MAKALKKYPNGLSLRYLKTWDKYFITFGVMHILINDKPNWSFDTIEQADAMYEKLKPVPYYPHKFTT
jgi:hypothetical protein